MATEKIDSNQTVTRFNRIRTEQLRLLAQQTLAALAGNTVAATILVIVLWDVANRGLLMAVIVAMPVAMMLRFLVAKTFLQNPARRSISSWSKRFLVSIGLMGLIWGFIGLNFFLTQNPWHLMFVSMVMLALTAAAIGSLSVYIPAYYIYITPMMSAIIFQFFLHSTSMSIALGVGGITFLASCIIWSRNLNRTILDSIKLRFENVDLVEQLSLQKDQATLAKHEAETANVAKSRFLAAASHDLRQPLHAQGLFLSALDEQLSDPQAHILVARIKNSSHMLRDLLDSLLDISKLDAGVMKPQFKTFPLQALFDDMLEEFIPQAEEKELRLSHVLTSAWVCSDREMLGRVLRNLLANAVNYTEQGRVLLGARRGANQIRIEVWDSGIGIHADDLEMIFDEFQQLNNPGRDRRKGLGLGLAIVRRLAGLLDHPMNVKSVISQGSIFQICVPQARAQPQAAATIITIPGDQLRGTRVLLVDDEQEIRQGFSVLLTQWGCIVATASGKLAAMEMVSRETKPDIIVADYRLQGEATGLQTIESIHQYLGVSIPAIIVTGDTAAERLQEAKASGFPLLHKPLQPSKLRTLMNTELLKARNKKQP